MTGRNINLQVTPLPEKQRVRKFANFKHGRFINPEEEDNDHSLEHDHDDHHNGEQNHAGENHVAANHAEVPPAHENHAEENHAEAPNAEVAIPA